MDEARLSKLEALLKLVDESITREEFVAAIEAISDRVANATDRIERDAELLNTSLEEARTKLTSEIASLSSETFSALKDAIMAEIKPLADEVRTKLSLVKDGYTPIKGIDYFDGRDGEPGKDANEAVIIERIIERRDAINDGPDEIRNKLELLQGEERLKLSAIDGVEAFKSEIETIRKTAVSNIPSRGVHLFVDGEKKGLVNTLNLIGSGGVTLTYNRSSGRNDITVTAGAGAFSIIATTAGAVNDTNTSFTFASEPKVVIVNGASYRHGSGCTISGTSVTLDNPVGTGGDIYGLG